MTYNAGHGDLRLEGDYVKLEVGVGGGADGGVQCLKEEVSPSCGGAGAGGEWWWLLWWWAKLLLVALFIGVLLAVFLKWIGPFVMEKEIIPLINWERESFSTKQLGLLIFGSLTIFPSILLPSSPSMWLAGMTFGYGYGFLLVVGGVIFGVSLPYFIGSLFYHKIQVWLERYPKRASVIRLAGEGSLFNQFRAVALIRISPFPYIVYNYCAVATDVKFGPYLLGTLVGMVPEIFLTLYTSYILLASWHNVGGKYNPIGDYTILSDPPILQYPVSQFDAKDSEVDPCRIMHAFLFVMYIFASMIGMLLGFSICDQLSGIIIQTLADATDDRQTMSGPQILFNIAGFCITAAATVLVTLYAKRRLKELQMEEVLVLQ